MEEKDKISSEIKTKLEDAQERIELSKKTHTKHKKQKNHILELLLLYFLVSMPNRTFIVRDS